jgi:hypothetical protein
MKNTALFKIITAAVALILLSCNRYPDSKNYDESSDYPEIFPDYTEIVIPPNIAPLNFDIKEKGLKYVVKISTESGKEVNIPVRSSVVKIKKKVWQKLLNDNKGKELKFNVYVLNSDRKWIKYKPFIMKVANEDIDEYLAYRLINVGYILWEKMGIYQRDLSSFNERPILHNRNTKGNCINCHSFCNNDPERIMFHMRDAYSGTIVSVKDSLFKVNMSTPYTMSAGVYPSWHPDGQHIAFSVNLVRQWFHAVDKRNEVYDRASDLIVYNLKTNTITTSPKVSTKRRETLPCWSPDGRYLYYCSAPEISDTIEFDEVKYDLLRIPFNTENNEWGEVDTVLLSSVLGKSISFPKISPDGKYLIFCLASHGYFTIYNVTSDLYILNLETKEYYPFPFNSNSVDSYHSWSSNGRWFVFSSKRSNGLCARPYISYFDESGKAYKPFLLPQKDPRFYYSFINNYNVPEMVKSSVSVNRSKLLETVINDPLNAEFDRNVELDALSGATRFANM